MVGVDRFRTTMGGWVRLVFKNVNGPPIAKVEFSKVRCVELHCGAGAAAPQRLQRPRLASGS